MAVLPIVERELRVVSRKTSLYWGRLVFAGLAIIIGALFLYSLSRGVPARIGQQMFVSLANLVFIYCVLAGVWVSSDCLSEERRSETLGLLFLTNLRGIDVVLGKMMATSLQTIYGVLAVLPVLAIPVILGGVSMAEFCRVMLVLVVTLLLSLSMGVCVSSRSRSAVKSGTAVFFALLVLCCLGPVFALALEASGSSQPNSSVFPWLMFMSPGFALFVAYDATFSTQSSLYWVSISTGVGLLVVLLGLACVFVQRGWRDWGDPTESDRPARAGSSVGPKLGLGRRRVGPRDENPIYWMLSRRQTKPRWVFVGLGFVLLYWFWGSFQFGGDFYNEGNYLVTAFVMQLILKCWVGAEAATRFGEERRSGALELLLCTPIQVKDVLKGHSQSFYWQFYWPVFLVLLVCFGFLLEPLTSRWALIDPSTRYWIRLFSMSMVLFVLDLYALSWLGMWKGLNARFVNRAIFSNLITVLLLPWIGFILFLIVIGVSSMRTGSAEDWLLGIWFVIGCVNSGCWWYWGRQCLLEELRHVATRQVGAVGGSSS